MWFFIKRVVHSDKSDNKKVHSLYLRKTEDISRASKDHLLQCSVRSYFPSLSILEEAENRLGTVQQLDFPVWISGLQTLKNSSLGIHTSTAAIYILIH